MIISTLAGDEGFVRSDLRDMAFVEDHDLVSISHRAEAMGDDDNRLAPVKIREVLYDGALVVCIQRIGRLIKVKEFRILVDGAGNQNPLPLPLAYALPILPNYGVIFQGKPFDELFHIRNTSGQKETGLIDVVIIHGNIPRDGFGEDIAVLHHGSALAAPPTEAEALQIVPADGNRPLDRFVIAQEELDEGGFAASAGADDGGNLSFRNGE